LPPVAIVLGLYLIFSDRINLNIGISQKFMPKKRALAGAFLMGLFFGIVSSPCATPVLAVILTFAAAKQDLVFSGGLLLAYALGHWVLVLGAGISNFSSWSKKIGGAILIGVGIYMIITYLL
jgi:cytochrome c-type biogenesis protein